MHNMLIGSPVCSQMSSGKHRAWMVTINNPTPADHWDALPHPNIKYMVWQLERGEETGTPHLQMAIQLANAERFARARELLGGGAATLTSHWEPMRGGWQKAYDYCTKTDTRVDGPWTLGVKPQAGKRNDIHDLKDAIDAGAPEQELWDDHTVPMFKYHRSATEYKRFKMTPRTKDDPMDIVLMEGAPGTGKTTLAEGMFLDWAVTQGYISHPHEAYRFASMKKWWDGYRAQQVVIVNEADGNWAEWQTCLNLLDKNTEGIRVEVKGGHVPWAARLVIFTTNVPTSEWYPAKHALLDALERRISHRIVFSGVGQWEWTKHPVGEPNLLARPPRLALRPPPAAQPPAVAPVQAQLASQGPLLQGFARSLGSHLRPRDPPASPPEQEYDEEMTLSPPPLVRPFKQPRRMAPPRSSGTTTPNLVRQDALTASQLEAAVGVPQYIVRRTHWDRHSPLQVESSSPEQVRHPSWSPSSPVRGSSRVVPRAPSPPPIRRAHRSRHFPYIDEEAGHSAESVDCEDYGDIDSWDYDDGFLVRDDDDTIEMGSHSD